MREWQLHFVCKAINFKALQSQGWIFIWFWNRPFSGSAN